MKPRRMANPEASTPNTPDGAVAVGEATPLRRAASHEQHRCDRDRGDDDGDDETNDDVHDRASRCFFYCRAMAMRKRSSGSMKWSWSSSPRSICTQWILPVKRLVCAV